jgi:hypothetical protein
MGMSTCVYLLYLIGSVVASTSDPSKYCPTQFDQVCPTAHREVGQLKCIVEKYRNHSIGGIDEKCIKLAIGMYQTYLLASDGLIEPATRNFNHPTECDSWHDQTHQMGRVDFTLVSQCSSDRLWMVGEVCKRWKGNIVVAVSGLKHSLHHIEGCGKVEVISKKGNTVHALQNHTAERQVAVVSFEVDISELYPVNKLRNAAM